MFIIITHDVDFVLQRSGGLDVLGTPVQPALAQPGSYAHVLAFVPGRRRPPRTAVGNGTAPPAPTEPATASAAAAAPPPPPAAAATAASAAATATTGSKQRWRKFRIHVGRRGRCPGSVPHVEQRGGCGRGVRWWQDTVRRRRQRWGRWPGCPALPALGSSRSGRCGRYALAHSVRQPLPTVAVSICRRCGCSSGGRGVVVPGTATPAASVVHVHVAAAVAIPEVRVGGRRFSASATAAAATVRCFVVHRGRPAAIPAAKFASAAAASASPTAAAAVHVVVAVVVHRRGHRPSPSPPRRWSAPATAPPPPPGVQSRPDATRRRRLVVGRVAAVAGRGRQVGHQVPEAPFAVHNQVFAVRRRQGRRIVIRSARSERVFCTNFPGHNPLTPPRPNPFCKYILYHFYII